MDCFLYQYEVVAGNREGNKVTETIFTGNREFITLAYSGGDNFSKP
jgi:hypothetical protein